MELTSTNSPCVLFSCNFLPSLVIKFDKISLVVMEERVHPTPFRTRQLSSPSPMILHNVMWESRPPPKIVRKAPAASCAGAFSFFLLFLLLPSCLPIFRLSASQEGVTAAACGLFCCPGLRLRLGMNLAIVLGLRLRPGDLFCVVGLRLQPGTGGLVSLAAASARYPSVVACAARRQGSGACAAPCPLQPLTPRWDSPPCRPA